MVAPHIKRRRRLARIEKVEPAPKAEAPKAAAPKAAPKKETETPEKKVKKIYKRKED